MRPSFSKVIYLHTNYWRTNSVEGLLRWCLLDWQPKNCDCVFPTILIYSQLSYKLGYYIVWTSPLSYDEVLFIPLYGRNVFWEERKALAFLTKVLKVALFEHASCLSSFHNEESLQQSLRNTLLIKKKMDFFFGTPLLPFL